MTEVPPAVFSTLTDESINPPPTPVLGMPAARPARGSPGLYVWQVRAALVGLRGIEYSNVLAAETNAYGVIRVDVELAHGSRHERLSGCRTHGLQICELQTFFADMDIADSSLTNVTEITDLGMDCIFFDGGHPTVECGEEDE